MPEYIVSYRNNHTDELLDVHVINENSLDNAMLSAHSALGAYMDEDLISEQYYLSTVYQINDPSFNF